MFSDMLKLVHVPLTIDTFKGSDWIKKHFIDRCFKLFLSRTHIRKQKVPTVEKKPMRFVLTYLGTMSLETLLSKFLNQVWFTSFIVDCSMNPILDILLDVRNGEHIGISPLTIIRVQPRNDSAISHLLLNCNFSATFQNFSVLCHENKKYILELKESLLIITNKPSVSRNILSAPLYMFERVFGTFFAALCGLLG